MKDDSEYLFEEGVARPVGPEPSGVVIATAEGVSLPVEEFFVVVF